MAISLKILHVSGLITFMGLCSCSRETPEDHKPASKQTNTSTSTSTATNTSSGDATANGDTTYDNMQTATTTSVFSTATNNNSTTTVALLNSFMTLLFGKSLPTGGAVNQPATLYQALNCQSNGYSAPFTLTLTPNNAQTKASCANNASMQVGSVNVNGACRNVANGSTMTLASFCSQNGLN